jgi:hypothetical protein
MKKIIVILSVILISLIFVIGWLVSEINTLDKMLRQERNTVSLYRKFDSIYKGYYPPAGVGLTDYIVTLNYKVPDQSAQIELYQALGGK